MKYFILFILSCSTFSFVDPEHLTPTVIELEKAIISDNFSVNTDDKTAISQGLKNNILSDYKNRIPKDFHINDYWKTSVEFWFSIYTQYSSHQVLVHDKDRLNLVYKVLDYSELYKQKINRYARANLQTSLSKEHSLRVKKSLNTLATKTENFSADEENILLSIKKADIKIPKTKKLKKKFFIGLAQNLRLQTGQRNRINQGILNYIPFENFFIRQFKNFKLPKELAAIAFLESSFNPRAQSKVSAAGLWQIMPFIGNILLPRKSKVLDYRFNPFVSTIAAMHLLRENKMILKRWDLAIPAYNSGTKHLVIARKKYGKKKDFSLEYILENYNHPHIGFASKNFYAEFLALVHVLDYKELISPIEGLKENQFELPGQEVSIYLSKCSFKPNWLFKRIKSNKDVKSLNTHLRNLSYSYPKGTMIVSDIKLTKRRYYKVSNEEIKKKRPKHWASYIRKQKCRSR